MAASRDFKGETGRFLTTTLSQIRVEVVYRTSDDKDRFAQWSKNGLRHEAIITDDAKGWTILLSHDNDEPISIKISEDKNVRIMTLKPKQVTEVEPTKKFLTIDGSLVHVKSLFE
jgi:hypothetical protein